MSDNLTKKEIKTVNAGVLNTRYCWLIKKGDEMPAGVITYADMKELIWIEDELHERLIKLLGRDFYPPVKAKPTIADLTRRKNAARVTEGKLRFKITIISSIGSVVKTLNVKVDTKSDADIMATEMIEKLGLKKATYKIS